MRCASWNESYILSAEGAKELSPALQRWVMGVIERECHRHGRPIWSSHRISAVPTGLGFYSTDTQRLKRWAKLFRPWGLAPLCSSPGTTATRDSNCNAAPEALISSQLPIADQLYSSPLQRFPRPRRGQQLQLLRAQLA